VIVKVGAGCKLQGNILPQMEAIPNA
jgi:hypothetical protein